MASDFLVSDKQIRSLHYFDLHGQKSLKVVSPLACLAWQTGISWGKSIYRLSLDVTGLGGCCLVVSSGAGLAGTRHVPLHCSSVSASIAQVLLDCR